MLPQPFFWPPVLFCALLEIMKSQVSVFVSPPLLSPLKTRFLSITGTSLCHRSSIKCIQLDSFEELLTAPPRGGSRVVGSLPCPHSSTSQGSQSPSPPLASTFPQSCVSSLCAQPQWSIPFSGRHKAGNTGKYHSSELQL